ncbi:MAG TPA: DUF5723 family protein, partial [Cytophagaceae bacterium]|nr:DUF5723 family protein [Cytophagaceae bacterium]
MKKYLVAVALYAYSISVFSQGEMSVYSATGRAGVATTFVTDYQSIGINPANLGYGRVNDSKKFTLGLLEFGGNVYHQGMSNNDFIKYGLHYKSVNLNDKISAANTFANNTVSINFDFTLLGISFQDEKFGGLAFSIRESFRYYSNITPTAADFAFRGGTSSLFQSLVLSNGTTVANNPNNYSQYENGSGVTIDSGKTNTPFTMGQVIGKSKIKQNWYRDYSLSYGRKIIDNNGIQLYGGVGVKYEVGYNYIDITSDGSKVNGNVALNPITNPVNTLGATSPSNALNNKYQPIGNGYGFDLGLSLSIKQKYKIGVSAVNIGSINYGKNVYSIKDTSISAVGVNQTEGFKAVGEAIRWQGEKSLKVSLPAMLRAGASMSLLNYKLEIGIDAIVPLNNAAGNYNNVLIAVGGDYKILKTIKLSSGFNMGGNTAKKFNLPLGITFSFNKTLEFGIASRDVISYFIKTGNSYSLAAGI